MSSQHTPKKIVLAYSGGLDTSIILTWLKEQYKVDIVALCVNIGQPDDLSGVKDKALKTGAVSCQIPDLREAFVRDYVFPMFRANAIYEGEYLLGTSIARPILAKALVDCAREVGADTIAHGATGKGNDQVRMELGAARLNPSLKVIAPWREWDLRSREDCIAYAKTHGIEIGVTKEKPYSMDGNLLHISYEGGVLEDPWAEPKENMFLLTQDPTKAPDAPKELVIQFEKGDAVAIDGKALSPAALLTELNKIAGEHGVGRVDIVENRFVGMKSRGVYETPGGTVLLKAHRAIESLTLDREVLRIKDGLVPEYAALIYRGFWFSPEREALQTLIDHSQLNVSGEVRLKLYKGSVMVTGRRSNKSLYRQDIATFEKDDVYNQADATGFIRLNGLRLKTTALRDSR